MSERSPPSEQITHAIDGVNALHPRMRIVWLLRAVVFAVVLGGLTVALDRYLLRVTPLLGVGVAIAVLAVGVVDTVLRYRRWTFDVQDDALALERGVYTEVESSVPYVRIQHVDTRRGLFSRLVGLSSVVVYTAGTHGSTVNVPGLTPDRARKLHDRIRTLAIRSEPEDGV